ncbi:MAG: sigma-54-dependent Fis family transcriptional regulator, partial [Coprobacter sp.]|nr:sigma-54-dependent Fis family transcriptional regulator [Coprobacter sp.]
KDYVSKPVNPEELLQKINEALSFTEENSTTELAVKNSSPAEDKEAYLEGESDAAQELYRYVRLVAPTPMSVLISGASGTGKEYIAHRIHQLSNRADKPFVAIDCGTIPRELAASEFFGHLKGSFTGAIQDKTGAFLEANGGTLFLDEIGNLGYETQVQLLRALQERKIKPIGSNREISVDIRLITATNENLENAIANGTFREDLYHRLNEFSIHMPPLKERKEDILHFANFFLDQANRELNKQLVGFDDEAGELLLKYHWPGNLRQMKNIIRRATLLASHPYITAAELNPYLDVAGDTGSCAAPHSFSLKNPEDERERILEALRQTRNNKSQAALLLNIDRKTLYNKLKLYRIE